MDQLEQYLESVRRGLDVRTEAERDEIVSEIRDHILTIAEKLQQEGVEHNAAISQAIEQAGDSGLVATSISGAHDGASWRQAWLAAIPIVAVAAALPLSLLLFDTPAAWPVFLALLVGVIGGYLYLSPRESGRVWRIAWLAVAAKSGVVLIVTLGYWLLLPRDVAEAGIGRFALAIRPSWQGDMVQWLGVFNRWENAAILFAVACILLFFLLRRRQWILALCTVALYVITVQSYFVFTSSPIHVRSLAIVFQLGLWLLWFSLAYAVFVKEWRGDWTMAWSFIVAYSAPLSTSNFGVLSFVGPWQETLVASIGILAIAGTLAAYVGLPRRFAFGIFIIGGLLYNHLNFMAMFPAPAWLTVDKLVLAAPFLIKLLLFRLIFWLVERKPVYRQLLYRQSTE